MITEKATLEKIEQWKKISATYSPLMHPNRKSGVQVDDYFKSKYSYQILESEGFRKVVEANIMQNDFSRNKLAPGKTPKISAYKVGTVLVGIDTVSGEIHVEAENINDAAVIYDDLFTYRGLDESDLKNYVMVAEYVRLCKLL